jgi:predicted RNase H-like HicB family nuclease
MIKIRIKMLVERDGDGYYAYCPDLPGLHVGADTEEELKALAKDAAAAYLTSLVSTETRSLLLSLRSIGQ